MPYRQTTDDVPCAVCETLTTRACRLCNRPLCIDHANTQPFFGVESVECIYRDRCHKPVRKTERRAGPRKPTRHYVLGHDKLSS